MQSYDVTYQSGGDEHTQRVEAPDAATAASMIQTEHGREEGLFELIAVNLVEQPESDSASGSLDESLTPS
jgi:hypothetical protein